MGLYLLAVFVDLANNASTDSFLLVFRKFTSIRGYHAKLYSDNGTQFRGACRELKDILKGINWKNVFEFGAGKGVEWHFSPADAPGRMGV